MDNRDLRHVKVLKLRALACKEYELAGHLLECEKLITKSIENKIKKLKDEIKALKHENKTVDITVFRETINHDN